MDTVLRALPPAERRARLFLPAGTEAGRGQALRAEGWVTVDGLEVAEDPMAEARRLLCSHILLDSQVREL
jgi:ATP phosphoribosyltransferase regulatory subunit